MAEFMLILVSHHGIFIAVSPIRTVKETSLHKSHHFVFVKIDFTKIAFPILIIGVVCTGFATCLGFLHIKSPFIFLKKYSKKIKKSQ